MSTTPKPAGPKPKYDCTKCPGYCCSYDWIQASERDIKRLAKHFGLTVDVARERFTKPADDGKIRILRHRKDHVYKSNCMFFDQKKRQCTVYESRPWVCRAYPTESKCGYFDFLMWEREQQGDDDFVPGLR